MSKPVLQMSDQDGNAFGIISRAMIVIKKWNMENSDDVKIDVDVFQKEAMSGDYDHVIQTCMKYCEVH